MRRAQSLLLAGVTAACMAFQFTQANATVVSGSSSSYGESVSLTITPTIPPGTSVSVTSGPTPTASGTAPGVYSDADSVLSATLLNLITTGVINASASSNIDGSAGAKYAMSSASVDELGISILNALGIGATVVEADATASGDYGALSGLGTTTIAGLSLNSIPLLDLTIPPDYTLLNLLGVTVTLNEQTASGDGTSSAGIGVNAIHISFDDVPYLGIIPNIPGVAGLINGDIIISHAEAAIFASPTQTNAVPEPGTLALLGTGLVAAFGLRRRRAA